MKHNRVFIYKHLSHLIKILAKSSREAGLKLFAKRRRDHYYYTLVLENATKKEANEFVKRYKIKRSMSYEQAEQWK